MIVVEDDQHIGAGMGGVRNGFKCHAGGHRAVADNGNSMAFYFLLARGNRHAQCCADTGAGVTNTKGIVGAFFTFRKTGQAIGFAHAAHSLTAAR